MDGLLSALGLGMGATAIMDGWTLARRQLLGVPALDYALVGRWVLWMFRGRFRHYPIATSPQMRGERPLGWILHYAIGIAFAALLLFIWGVNWLVQPSLLPALVVGFGSVAAPFFVMQPAFGMGIAASRTARPQLARVQSAITHAIFGLGLYLTGEAMSTMVF